MHGLDIGAKPSLQYPFMLYDTSGAHGLVILLAGENERAATLAELPERVTRLCELRTNWCIAVPDPRIGHEHLRRSCIR